TLAARWIIASAEQAWRDRKVQTYVDRLSARGASPNVVLLLSFVPVELFETRKIRLAFAQDRQLADPIVKRYENPLTNLSADEGARRKKRGRFDLVGPFPDAPPLRADRARAHRVRDRDREGEICTSCGLEKTPRSEIPRHELWWWIAHP